MAWGSMNPSNGSSTDRPYWFLGDDRFDGRPIGPNGPGLGSGGSFGSGYGPGTWDQWQHGYGPGFLPMNQQQVHTAVTKCLQELVSPLVRSPWETYERGTGGFGTTLVDDSPAWMGNPMLRGPVPGIGGSSYPDGQRLTSYSFWSTFVSHAIMWGRGVLIFARGSDGQPKAGTFRLLNPFSIRLDETGHWVIGADPDNQIRTDYESRFTIGGVEYQVLVMRGLPPHDDKMPSGVLIRHWDAFRLGARIQGYAEGIFTSGVPSGYLRMTAPNATQEHADELKARWMQAHGGDRRSIAVLNATTEFTPISINPIDADTDKISRLSLMSIAHAFGLPSAVLDVGGDSLTYANLNDRERSIISRVLSAWAAELADTLSAILPYGITMRVRLENLLLPDELTLANKWLPVLQSGAMTIAEYRHKVGLGDWPDADMPAVPRPDIAAPLPPAEASPDTVVKEATDDSA